MSGPPPERSGIYIDRRMGGIERWSLGPPEDGAMHIPDNITKNVCFYGIENPDGTYYWGGTAFFFTTLLEDAPQFAVTYLITARHNVDDAAAEAKRTGGRPCLRANTNDGSAKAVSLATATWILPDDPHVDVAVIRWTPPTPIEYVSIFRESLVTPEVVKREGIGIGDELFMVGLFTRRAGQARNEPIARTGIIAGIPSEPLVNARTNGPMHGCYLAELRSIGGLSGSPVYAYLPSCRVDWAGGKHRYASQYFLLGLIYGHWPLDRSGFISSDYGDGEEPLNTGIAIVAPITEALALIDSPVEIAWRAERARIRLAETAPVADAGLSQ
jgi:hypothetical protein